MSGRLAPIDVLVTVGAFILTLGLYKMVKPMLFSYATTRLVSDEMNEGGMFTVKQCSQTESKECCKEGAVDGMVSEESMTNCHLCHHPDCTGVTAEQDDPAISLPFKKNIVHVIKPKGREIYDYVNQYARAYFGSTYGPITPSRNYGPIRPANNTAKIKARINAIKSKGGSHSSGGGGGSGDSIEYVDVNLTKLPGCECICQPTHLDDNYDPRKWKMETHAGEACTSNIYGSGDECTAALQDACEAHGDIVAYARAYAGRVTYV